MQTVQNRNDHDNELVECNAINLYEKTGKICYLASWDICTCQFIYALKMFRCIEIYLNRCIGVSMLEKQYDMS